jgi:serralysin
VLNIDNSGERSTWEMGENRGPQAFLNAEQRGATAANGKPSMTIQEAGFHLIGGEPGWSGALGQGYNVTYAFRSAAPTTMPDDTGGFSRFSAAQIAQTERALLSWSDVANITFTRVGSGTGSNAYSNSASILFANYATGAAGAAAFGNYPGNVDFASSSGDVWVNSTLSYNANPVQGGYGGLVLVHEIGHAIGLAHPGEYDAEDGVEITYAADAEYYEDSVQYTVMSYFDETDTGASFKGAYGAVPMLDDISAAQQEYGVNTATRTGDTVYGFNSTADRVWFSATNANTILIFAVWDAGGVDTFDFSGFNQAQIIDLQSGHFSNVGGLIGNVAIAANVVIESAIGGSGADTLQGNAAANSLYGNGGNDQLTGGAGADVLQGGSGFDFARYDMAVGGVVVSLATGGGSGGEAAGDLLTGIEGLVGSLFGDGFTGDLQANTLYGLAGDDTLAGGASGDTLDGGDGNDQLYGGDQNDYVIGGGGFDFARYDTSNVGVSVNLATGLAAGGEAAGDALSAIEGLVGSTFGDLLAGDAGANSIYGLAGDDTLTGAAGSDSLDGGDGNDHLYGGAGGDVLVGGAGYDFVRYDSSAGVAVNLTIGLGLFGEAAGDVLSGIEGLVGSQFADGLTGEAGANSLYGLGGDDTLAGGAGGDTLDGGDGDDHLHGGVDNDYVIGGAGYDFARYDDAAAGVEVSLATGLGTAGQAAGDVLSGIEGLVGSAFGDVLVGDGSGNSLYALAGDDVLQGGGGGDLLAGGDGADRFLYLALGDSTASAVDQILDFSLAEGDRVDLTAIDANTGLAGDQAFVLAGAFSSQAGQAVLTYDANHNTTSLGLDVNGDSQSDFLLTLSGHLTTAEGFLF